MNKETTGKKAAERRRREGRQKSSDQRQVLVQLIVQREKVDRERPNTGERWAFG